LFNQLKSEGRSVQFVVLSDGNASDFVSRISVPIFRDPNRDGWRAFRADVVKHDTFVFDAQGKLVLTWRVASGTSFSPSIGAAVRMLPP